MPFARPPRLLTLLFRTVLLLMDLDVGTVGIPFPAAPFTFVQNPMVVWNSLGVMVLLMFPKIAGLAPAAIFSQLEL